METTPAVIAYAPLIAAIVIGTGIIVTLAIVAGRIIFHLGGLFTEVSKLSSSVEGLRTELPSSVEGLRTDMSAMRIELRDEIRQSADRILRSVQHHRHSDTDGSVTFTVPPDGD